MIGLSPWDVFHQGISLKTGILFLIEIGVPINIVPIMYIYRVDKALNEQNYQ